MQMMTKYVPWGFDSEVIAGHPVARVYLYEGHQVAVCRECDYDGSPSICLSFQTGMGLISLRTPFESSPDGHRARDDLYAALAGHREIPKDVVDMVRLVWEDHGRPDPLGGESGNAV